MNAMPATTAAGAILGLLFVVLSARVSFLRVRRGVSLGDGGSATVGMGKEAQAPALVVAIRSHANFCEYAPLSLVLLGLVERASGPGYLAWTLAILLVIGRLIHPFGLGRRTPNPLRGGGIALNLVMLVVASILLLVRVAG